VIERLAGRTGSRIMWAGGLGVDVYVGRYLLGAKRYWLLLWVYEYSVSVCFCMIAWIVKAELRRKRWVFMIWTVACHHTRINGHLAVYSRVQS